MANIELEPGATNPPSETQKTNIRSALGCGQTGDNEFATNKASLADGDKFGILDSEASDAPKHTLWSTIKSSLTSFFGTAATKDAETSAIAGDVVPLTDGSGRIEVGYVRLIQSAELYNGTNFDQISPQTSVSGPLTYTLPTSSGTLAITSQTDGSISTSDVSGLGAAALVGTSTGGNGAADSGKAPVYGSGGQLVASCDAAATAVFSGENSNSGQVFSGVHTGAGGAVFSGIVADNSVTLLDLSNAGASTIFGIKGDQTCTVGATLAANLRKSITPTQTITTSPVTLATTDHIVLADDDGGADTINLPAASGNSGLIYRIKKLGTTGNITIDGNGAETIDGSTTAVLTTQYESITLICDGSNWHIL